MILGKTTLESKFYAASYYITKSAKTQHKSSEHKSLAITITIAFLQNN